MALIIFFLINSLETFLVAFFIFSQGSLSPGNLVNNLSGSRLLIVILLGIIGILFMILAVLTSIKKVKVYKYLTSFFQKVQPVLNIIFCQNSITPIAQ